MHGSICCIVKKFVEVNHGSAAWETILENAGHPGLVLSPIATYPDEAVVELLTAGCELLGCDLGTLLKSLGRFAAPELLSFAANMLHPSWKSFELLANVETIIHRTIRIQNPEAQPANIQAFRLNENTVQVIYSSRRGLCDLAEGILNGLGEFYNENLEVRQLTCSKQGEPFCTFEVTKLAEAPEERTEDIAYDRNTEVEEELGETCVISEQGAADPSDNFSGSFNWYRQESGRIRTSSAGRSPRQSKIPFPKRLGRYTIHEILGVGGMGVVYKATDETLNRAVAIKTLKSVTITKELSDPFIEEARAMARISHENVIRVYDVGIIHERPFFVMEYLDGQPLSDRIAKGRLNLHLMLTLFRKTLDGLNAVHNIGLVHRDIKPDNIMLSFDAQKCHLLDFGLADELSARRDTEQRLSGTPGYIAPERLKGYPADYRSDFFSLGCVAFEMLCGKRVFSRKSTRSVLNAMQSFDQDAVDWFDTPKPLQDLISSMLLSDPQARMTDYKHIHAEIMRSLEGLPKPDAVDRSSD